MLAVITITLIYVLISTFRDQDQDLIIQNYNAENLYQIRSIWCCILRGNCTYHLKKCISPLTGGVTGVFYQRLCGTVWQCLLEITSTALWRKYLIRATLKQADQLGSSGEGWWPKNGCGERSKRYLGGESNKTWQLIGWRGLERLATNNFILLKWWTWTCHESLLVLIKKRS